MNNVASMCVGIALGVWLEIGIVTIDKQIQQARTESSDDARLLRNYDCSAPIVSPDGHASIQECQLKKYSAPSVDS